MSISSTAGWERLGLRLVRQRSKKSAKAFLKAGLVLWACVDLLGQAFGEVGDALLELIDGLLELLDLGLDVAEELGDQIGELGRVGHVGGEDALAVLVEDGGGGVLEDDVVEGIAGLALLLDLGFEVVGGVLGLPVAADEVHGILEGAIGADGLAARAVDLLFVLGDEGPAMLLAGGGEEGVEGRAGAHFVHDVLVGEVGQVGVVLVDELGELGFARSGRGWAGAVTWFLLDRATGAGVGRALPEKTVGQAPPYMLRWA